MHPLVLSKPPELPQVWMVLLSAPHRAAQSLYRTSTKKSRRRTPTAFFPLRRTEGSRCGKLPPDHADMQLQTVALHESRPRPLSSNAHDQSRFVRADDPAAPHRKHLKRVPSPSRTLIGTRPMSRCRRIPGRDAAARITLDKLSEPPPDVRKHQKRRIHPGICRLTPFPPCRAGLISRFNVICHFDFQQKSLVNPLLYGKHPSRMPRSFSPCCTPLRILFCLLSPVRTYARMRLSAIIA